MFIINTRVCVTFYLKIRCGRYRLPKICLHKPLQRKITNAEQLYCIVWIFLWSSCVWNVFRAMTFRYIPLMLNIVMRRKKMGEILESCSSCSCELVSNNKCVKYFCFCYTKPFKELLIFRVKVLLKINFSWVIWSETQ